MSHASLDEEEKRLARKLRDVCTPYGEERKSQLSESTRTLYLMGLSYVKKAEVTRGMNQKLNFVKAAALLHGAKVRSEKYLKNRFKSEICNAIDAMQNFLLDRCHGNLRDILLSEISQHVLAMFESHRSAEKRYLDSLEIIEEDIPKDEAEKKHKEKTITMQKQLALNSENYKTEMKYVAKKCVEIMGPQPCGFAIVGLGSLARDEVTLYSDFEHVFILEEGVQNREGYANVLEYFRWLSVVFHLIIIGIGETIIPSVGVESINDLYTSEKSKNWFYDSFTPSGVSFDGMMPHACKIPIGRQVETKNKNFILELIKPVKEMALYLTKQQDIKNGYCLKDVLCETCLVFGSEKIYFHFKKESEKILGSEDYRKSPSHILHSAQENSNPYVSGQMDLPPFDAVDAKFTFYRPLSVFIGYFERLQGSGGRSGFDKIIRFTDPALLVHKESILWAFAVACEIRLKLYTLDHGNRSRHFGKNILKYIGKSCLVNCASAIVDLCLQLSVSHQHDARLFHHVLGTKSDVLMFLGEHADAKEALLAVIAENKLRGLPPDLCNFKHEAFLATIYFHDALSVKGVSESNYNGLLKTAEDILIQIEDNLAHPKICYGLSEIYCELGCYEDARKFGDAVFKTSGASNFTNDEIMAFRDPQLRAARACMEPGDFMEYCNEFLSENVDVMSRLTFGLASAKAHCEVGKRNQAKQMIQNLLKTCVIEGPNLIRMHALVQWMDKSFVLQEREGWYDDCVETLRLFENLTESFREHVDSSIYAPNFHFVPAVKSFLMASAEAAGMKSTLEKIKLCEKAIEICHRSENLDKLQPWYCCAVKLIILYLCEDDSDEFGISKLHELMMDAPLQVQNEVEVQNASNSYLFSRYFALCTGAAGTLPKEILHRVFLGCRIAGALHPVMFPFMHALLGSVEQQLFAYGTPLRLWKQVLSGPSGVNHSISNLKRRLFQLWRSLYVKATAIAQAYSNFLDFINGYLCIDMFLCSVEFLTSHPLVYLQNINPRFQHEMKNAIAGFGNFDLECVRVFWKFINTQKRKESPLFRMCIVFLLSSIIHSLFLKFGYQIYVDVRKWKICAGPLNAVIRLMQDLDRPELALVRNASHKLS